MSDEPEKKEPTIGFGIYIIFAILVCIVAAVIIHDASGFLSGLGKHLTHLFENAGLNPNNQEKFGNFVELILIAAFFGWAWTRFKRK